MISYYMSMYSNRLARQMERWNAIRKLNEENIHHYNTKNFYAKVTEKVNEMKKVDNNS